MATRFGIPRSAREVECPAALTAPVSVPEQPTDGIEERPAAVGSIDLDLRIGRALGEREIALENIVVTVRTTHVMQRVDEVPVTLTVLRKVSAGAQLDHARVGGLEEPCSTSGASGSLGQVLRARTSQGPSHHSSSQPGGSQKAAESVQQNR